MNINHDTIIILDYGSQYTKLIARRIREEKVYSEIVSCNVNIDKIKQFKPKGIILSGGPNSVTEKGSPRITEGVLELGVPILGICYGMHLIAHTLKASVEPSNIREYGHAQIIRKESPLFHNLPESLDVWMSHGDKVSQFNDNFNLIATSNGNIPAAISHKTMPFYGLQFHPEVAHTPKGDKIIQNFVFNICQCQASWDMKSFLDQSIQKYRQELENKNVILGLSGGVDSTVTAALLHKAIGNRLHCIFINNGLLRLNEENEVNHLFQQDFKFNFIYKDESGTFLNALQGVSDPEKKRKIIGKIFIEAFERAAKDIPNITHLAQGTLYPDVIESVSFKGPSVTIKSHHNVGGLPDRMNMKLVEPLRELFKDEVRNLGKELNLPSNILLRHPFPGPGLAVRILGDITPKRLEVLKKADAIYITELKKHNLYDKIWQALAVLLPVKSVGVMGDYRSYENVLAIRAVNSTDGMTASCHPIPHEILSKISTKIINEVAGINRVVYDISSKPPSTIEWE